MSLVLVCPQTGAVVDVALLTRKSRRLSALRADLARGGRIHVEARPLRGVTCRAALTVRSDVAGRWLVESLENHNAFSRFVLDADADVGIAWFIAGLQAEAFRGDGTLVCHRRWGTRLGQLGTGLKRFVETSYRWDYRRDANGGRAWDLWDSDRQPLHGCPRRRPPFSWRESVAYAAVLREMAIAAASADGSSKELHWAIADRLGGDVIQVDASALGPKDMETVARRCGRHTWAWPVVSRYLQFAEREDLLAPLAAMLDVPFSGSPARENAADADPFEPPHSWIYFIEERDGDRVKIGWSGQHSPLNRVRDHLRSSSCSRALRPVFVLRAPPDTERLLHRRFADYLAPSKTEWFIRAGALADVMRDEGESLATELRAPRFLVRDLEVPRAEVAA